MLIEGLLPVNKATSSTSFQLVAILRKRTKIEKIGHAGTLDPFATGVMVMLIGRTYTRLSDRFLGADKEYLATITLGRTTDTFDLDGQELTTSDLVPTLSQLEKALLSFQGDCQQVPPMFSAKKIAGKKLYELARKGVTVDRAPVNIHLQTTLLRYEYPQVELRIACSKGTYIRSIAQDLGVLLGSGAYVSALSRTRSGTFTLADCVDQEKLCDPTFDFTPFIKKEIP